MLTKAEIRIEDDAISLQGDLDFSNAMAVYRETLPSFADSHEIIIIDFAGLNSSNSVVIAMIVEWIRLAKKNHKKVMFRHLSSEIMAMAKVSGLYEIVAQCEG